MFTPPTSSRWAMSLRDSMSLVHTVADSPYWRVVCQPDGLLFVGDLHHRDRRAERLVAHAGHRMIDVEKDRGLEELATAGRFPPVAIVAPRATASST